MRLRYRELRGAVAQSDFDGGVFDLEPAKPGVADGEMQIDVGAGEVRKIERLLAPLSVRGDKRRRVGEKRPQGEEFALERRRQRRAAILFLQVDIAAKFVSVDKETCALEVRLSGRERRLRGELRVSEGAGQGRGDAEELQRLLRRWRTGRCAPLKAGVGSELSHALRFSPKALAVKPGRHNGGFSAQQRSRTRDP